MMPVARDKALTKHVSWPRKPPQGLRAPPACVTQLLVPRGVQSVGRKTAAFLGPHCSFSYTWAHFDAQKTGPRNGRAGREKRPRHLSGAHTTRWGVRTRDRHRQTETETQTQTKTGRQNDRQPDIQTQLDNITFTALVFGGSMTNQLQRHQGSEHIH